MNFDLSSDQKMLVDTAASFAKKSSPVTRARRLRDDPLGYEPAVWRQMGELGWLGLCLPEDAGGFGGRFIDLALVLEQFGKTLVPEPIIPAVVLAGTALVHTVDSEQRSRWLAPLAAGELMVSLGWLEQSSGYRADYCETRAERRGSSYVLSGRKVWAGAANAAGLLLISARTSGDAGDGEGISLFAIDRDAPGVSIEALATMDGRRAAHITLDKVEVGVDRLLGAEGQAASVIELARDAAAAAACAEGMGIAQAVLDMTVDYLKTREQFGVRIGSFQALQHRAVDMFVETELTRSHAIEACLRVDYGEADQRQQAISAAMVQLATGGRQVVRQGIQLHGGIGCTDEHDVGLYFKRMQILGHLYGDERYHLARFADLTQPIMESA